MRNNVENRKKLKNIIKETLIDDQVNIGDKEEDTISRCASDLLSKTQDYFDSKTLENEDLDTYYLFKMWDQNSTIENFLKELEKRDYDYKEAQFFFFVSTMKEFINLELNIKQIKMQQKAKKKFKNITCNKDIGYEIILFNTKSSYKFDVSIESRIKSLENSRIIKVGEEESDTLLIKGYVFTANLFDITKIYNHLGNELFTSNIRFGIEDKLNVDSEIKKTIDERPEEFWFMNNGITMVVKDNDFCLKRASSIELNYGKDKTISVINGAQTITASAKYFYQHDEQDIGNIKNSKIQSKVILRLIHIKNINKMNQAISDEEIDKISLALNRQKPIEQEDIAYTTLFVSKFNTIKEKNNNKFNFSLIRRGDSSVKGYTLEEFARATTAYLVQNPGKARSSGKKTLLKIKTIDKGYALENEKIFIPDICEEENNLQEIFNKYYKPVNFAIDVERYYSKKANEIKNKIKDDKNIDDNLKRKQIAILNYGKWHFIAYIIYALNKLKHKEDYTNFDFILNNISQDIFDQIIMSFITSFGNSISKKGADIDSNDFKKNDLYKQFKDSKQSKKFMFFIEKSIEQDNYLKEIAASIEE